MKKLLSILIFLGILFSLCSCGSDSKYLVSNSKGETTKPPANSQAEKMPSFQIAKVIPSQLVSSDKAVTLANFTYQVKGVSVSKKLTGFQKEDVEYFMSETADDSGNLTSAHSYIYIDITIKNMLAKEVENGLTDFQVVSIASDNSVNRRVAPELRLFDKSQHENSRKYGFYKFKPNEETTFRLGYIISDKGLKENLYFEVNPTGVSGYYNNIKQYNPDVIKYIKLKIS